MKASRALRWARLTAGLSQRVLAEKSGVPQSTIGRIETVVIDPRTSMLSRLLRTCGYDLEVEPLLGQGIDRTLIRERLALSPTERLAYVTEEVEDLNRFLSATRRSLARVRDSRKAG
jgi:transcriptional regulator with XRE-family HTH domain